MMGNRSRTSTWSSTVAGVLSIHSPKLFKSGQHVFKESGWWGLQEVVAPFQDADVYKIYKSLPAVPYISPSDIKIEKKLKDGEYGRGKRQRKEKKHSYDIPSSKVSKLKNVQECKSRITIDTRNEHNSMEKLPTLKIKIEKDNSNSIHNVVPAKNTVTTNLVKMKSEPIDYEDMWQMKATDISTDMSTDFTDSYDMEFSPSDDPFPFLEDAISSIASDFTDETIPAESNMLAEAKPVAGKSSSVESDLTAPTPSETPPVGAEDVTNKGYDQKLRMLTPIEEMEFLQKINSCPNVLECDSSARRLRRKLMLRKLKRDMGLEVFNLDESIRKLKMKSAPESIKFLYETKEYPNVSLNANGGSDLPSSVSYHHPALRGVNVLDRFQNIQQKITLTQTSNLSFFRLIGNAEDDHYDRLITSPYTSRVLKPYIRRDFQTLPPKLKLLQEIRASGPNQNMKRYPLDYCYVQPNHIPSVNALCSEFFWPGIDVTECLQYPEFSCVVLYRRLLVGFAFMVPDVSYNEAYISFILVHPDWQRAGIATNLIYHLIQTCMGKDITLHVSPTNPSMMLYQKFGFKAEALILDFYEKYLPDEYNKCKHAFLLRLQR